MDSSDEEGNIPEPTVQAADSLQLDTFSDNSQSLDWDADSEMESTSDGNPTAPESDVASIISLGSTAFLVDSDDTSLESISSASAAFSSISGNDFTGAVAELAPDASPPYNPASPTLSDISIISLSSASVASPTVSQGVPDVMVVPSYSPAAPVYHSDLSSPLTVRIQGLQDRYNALMIRASLEGGPATVRISYNFLYLTILIQF